ncbi:MAG TPA: ABC transporter permease [Candidatus Binatia bacterium]|nr:ABC transporter permease [Candidatus Binatia bacterium]
MRESLRLFCAFLLRDFRTEISYRFSFLLSMAGIVFTAVTYFFVARLLGESVRPLLEPYGGDYFAFALIGVAFASYFTLGLSGFARALRLAQTTGTLEAMLMSPAPVSAIILGSASWSYVFTTFRVVVYLLLGMAMGMELGNANYGGAAVTLLLAVSTFAALGIIAASIIMVTKRGDPVTALFGGFATLVGGVFYPVEIMPGWLQGIANLLPITYALHAMRLALLQGASWRELQSDLLALIAFAVVLFPLSLLVFRYAVERARREGSLAHY